MGIEYLDTKEIINLYDELGISYRRLEKYDKSLTTVFIALNWINTVHNSSSAQVLGLIFLLGVKLFILMAYFPSMTADGVHYGG